MIPFTDCKPDSRLHTLNEYYRSIEFVRSGKLVETKYKPSWERQLAEMGYKKENHHSYHYYLQKHISNPFGRNGPELQNNYKYISIENKNKKMLGVFCYVDAF